MNKLHPVREKNCILALSFAFQSISSKNLLKRKLKFCEKPSKLEANKKLRTKTTTKHENGNQE